MSSIGSKVLRHTVGAALLLASVCFAGTALAQSEEDRANARAAAGAGADAFDAGDYKKAADFFERAESLVHSPVHLWYISRSAKELGQLVKARELCLRVKRESLSGASKGVVAAHDGCDDILKELEGRIPVLTIDVSGLPSGLKYSVQRNGGVVSAAVIGIPAPVDPGEYTVTGSASGYHAEAQKVAVAEGAKAHVTLAFQPGAAVAVVPPPKPQETTPAAEPAATEPATSAPPEADRKGGLSAPPVASYILWGAGLGGVAFGVVMGLDSQAKADEADRLCGSANGGSRSNCFLNAGSDDAAQVETLNSQAGLSQALSIVGYGVGGAAIATGVLLWILDANKKGDTASLHDGRHPEPMPRLRPVLGFGQVGVAGTF